MCDGSKVGRIGRRECCLSVSTQLSSPALPGCCCCPLCVDVLSLGQKLLKEGPD